MTDTKAVMKMALDALIEYVYAKTDKSDNLGFEAIRALREAIAQPEQPANAYEIAAGLSDIESRKWIKEAQRHLPHHQSDCANRDFARAKLFSDFSKKIRLAQPPQPPQPAIAQPEQPAQWHPTHAAITALKRFEETCSDDEGYDVPKDTMRSLAAIGLIYRTHGARYCITDFGEHILAASIAQPEQQTPVRQPLTHEQIEKCTRQAHDACEGKLPPPSWSIEFARAIEAAHGITKAKT